MRVEAMREKKEGKGKKWLVRGGGRRNLDLDARPSGPPRYLVRYTAGLRRCFPLRHRMRWQLRWRSTTPTNENGECLGEDANGIPKKKA